MMAGAMSVMASMSVSIIATMDVSVDIVFIKGARSGGAAAAGVGLGSPQSLARLAIMLIGVALAIQQNSCPHKGPIVLSRLYASARLLLSCIHVDFMK